MGVGGAFAGGTGLGQLEPPRMLVAEALAHSCVAGRGREGGRRSRRGYGREGDRRPRGRHRRCGAASSGSTNANSIQMELLKRECYFEAYMSELASYLHPSVPSSSLLSQ
ncbi:hypothetical protein BS78_06G091100 [Paspalum vaginatum]|nr:hypothetical protein BS78_06G091100 [Paspalum vaginatum]